jgi:hypothetical protein
MSCGCGSDYGSSDGYNGVCDTDTPYPSISHESVPSLIDNLVNALYGSFSKQIDPATGRIVWNVPCTPTTQGIGGITPNAGEGMLCYLARALNELFPDASAFVTLNGIQTLTNKTLASPVFTGTQTFPNGSIALSALNGTQNLGLGTTSPSYKAEVTGAGTGYKTSYSPTPGNNGAASYFFGGTGGGTFIANSIYLNSSGTLIASNTAGGYIRIGIDGTLQFANFTGQTVGATPTTAQRIGVDLDGNVGVGTATPLAAPGYTTVEVKNSTIGAIFRATNASVDGRLQTDGTASSVGTYSNHNFNVIQNGQVRLFFPTDGTINANNNIITNARYQGVITGVTNASNAAAGNVGEVISAASATVTLALSTTWYNLTQITLTPGDWLVTGYFSFGKNATALPTRVIGSVHTTNTWAGSGIGSVSMIFAAPPAGADNTAYTFSAAPIRINVTANTVYFLNVYSVYGGTPSPSMSASGTIQAIRFR